MTEKYWGEKIPQFDPPRPPKDYLPTMYDLPSEDPKEPGLPDEFHLLQPQLLKETFQPPTYSQEQCFVATDLNLYFDIRHPLWYKRPDWFAVVGIPRLYDGSDLRLSYVIWQEGVSPIIVVELLSPGTEKEDLGKTRRETGEPPTKWIVYEQILRIPYYIIFDRYTDQLRIFQLMGDSYGEITLKDNLFWIAGLELHLGLWQGQYQGVERLWLRWADKDGNWLLTSTEQTEQERLRAEQERLKAEQAQLREEAERLRAEQEHLRAEQVTQQLQQERLRTEQADQRADQERQRAERLAAKLRALGEDPDQL
ncbi:MAG: Uma2 family endonuclease [Acidobacteriota bacterium]